MAGSGVIPRRGRGERLMHRTRGVTRVAPVRGRAATRAARAESYSNSGWGSRGGLFQVGKNLRGK